MKKEYLEANKALWNERVEAHVNSEFYDNDSFLDGRSTLQQIELDLLGNIKGKRVLHLQCHFGQDTLSLARMGAKVTGVDFSEKAIEQARRMNNQLQLDAHFTCCNVLEVDEHIQDSFDLIFTSYGTIGWLPELNRYFKNIHKLLADNGKYLIVDFHPVYWMFDSSVRNIEYSYFNTEVIEEEHEGSYASQSANAKMKEFGWNHPFSEIFQEMNKNGLGLTSLKEYDYSPYNIFKNGVKNANGYQIKDLEGKMPLVYALEAHKM